jgi:alkanesulfonate monooxygenase
VGNVIAREGQFEAAAQRPPSLDYLASVARAAEDAGFVAALTPTGSGCEDSWVACAAIAQCVRRLRFIVAFRPSTVHPAWAAHQAATFQRLFAGRLLVNIVSGGDPVEQRAFGDFLEHDGRYARTDEFLEVFRGMWQSAAFDHVGEFFPIEQGGLHDPPGECPAIYFGGASGIAEQVAARHATVYLMWGERPDAAQERAARIRALAREQGRTIRVGIRLHVIARETADQAWQEARRLLDCMDPTSIAEAQKRFARMDSVGQARMTALHGGSRDGLEISPNLWAGIGLVREGAGTALVGSYGDVAERLREYEELGFDEFILSGYPHLEEAYRVGELVLPRLADR